MKIYKTFSCYSHSSLFLTLKTSNKTLKQLRKTMKIPKTFSCYSSLLLTCHRHKTGLVKQRKTRLPTRFYPAVTANWPLSRLIKMATGGRLLEVHSALLWGGKGGGTVWKPVWEPLAEPYCRTPRVIRKMETKIILINYTRHFFKNHGLVLPFWIGLQNVEKHKENDIFSKVSLEWKIILI